MLPHFQSFPSKFKMGASVRWSWLAALLCLLCVEVECDCSLDNVRNQGGGFILSKGLEKGSMLVFNCSEGYYPYPKFSHICYSTGWDPPPKRNQRCKLVECPDPTVMQNGNVYPFEEKYYVTNTTTYTCYSGYTLRGSSTRTCLPNGKWSGSTPICSHDSGDTCADPGIPPGASRTGNIFEIDDKVKYTCSGDLILVGQNERVCQENGQWTGKEPACYYKYTFDTALEISEEFGNAIKDTLTTLQPADDTQEGRIIRMSKNGTLNIYIGVDISESIDKTYFQKAREAIVTLMKKISSFTVSPNYEIVFFSSEIYEVVNILDFFGEKPSLSSLVEKVESFEIGDRNTGTNLYALFRRFEERMSFIQTRTKEKFKEHRHVIILFTDGAYNMDGSPEPTVARIKNMVYSNHDEKTKEEYLDIYVFAIGVEVSDVELQSLVAGTGGKHYFRLKHDTNLNETFDDIIDERDVVGLCGLHKGYDTTEDKVSKRKRYPWVVFVIIQGEKSKRCLGSLVSSKFVLTAAHCFQFGDTPDQVTVEIEDRPGNIVKKVKTFNLHPEYNIKAKQAEGVKEFYDYDVALIQLQDDIDISGVARPICIPCTQETSDALQLVGVSTCAQQEQVLLNKQRERLSFLTRTEPLVKEKDVFAKLGDNVRNACINKALKAEGIKVTDPTIPVTKNFLCTGGLTEHRDQIACTGDSGGAVFKTYEYRTIQVGVVSWGTQSLCTSGGLVESNEDSRDFHINLFRVVPFLKSILGKDDQDDYAPIKFLKD
ncbi:complement factor B-like isoform X2 [Melanotaenia boesemani]|uniref:complement factor B-like isoform X2 n=1 Tax=Melanotaenia boesemani TaxID=1250792 RepID=UPI001C05CF66|nr:complement factor B-like isoform X2 [Melanotaenia boesemani]